MQRVLLRARVIPAWASAVPWAAPSILRGHALGAVPSPSSCGRSPTRMQHSQSAARNNDTDAVAVVVGGSRGIGLAMVQQLSRRWKGKIVATCRDRHAAGALGALWQFMPDRFAVLSMDVCDEQSIRSAAEELREWAGTSRVDLLVQCAGVLHEDGNMPETSLARVNADFFRRNLEVNLMGPVLVAKHFTPLMVTSRKAGRVPSVLAALSARVGSISDNGLGGWLSYRSSKAGQNQAMRTMSIELGRRGIICVSLHPGTVETDLSAPFRKNVRPEKLFAVDKAAEQLLDVIDSLGPDDNGAFLAYDRTPIPY